jgi:hypothetical protein
MIIINTHPDQEGIGLGFASSDLPSSDFSTSESLKRYTFQNIAPAILSESEHHQRLTHSLLDCSQSITLTRSGRVIHHARCKRTICLLCSRIKAEKEQAIVSELPDHLPFSMVDDTERDESLPQAIGIKITLNSGGRVPGTQIKQTIKQLHKSFGCEGLLKTKQIKERLLGYHRATEVTLDLGEDRDPHNLSANPHIHALLWFDVTDITADNRAEFTKEMISTITKRWIRLIRRRFKGDASKLAQRIEPLRAHTRSDVAGWLTYTMKGIVPEIAASIPSGLGEVAGEAVMNVWRVIEDQLKGLHLHQASRNISHARKDAEAVIKLRRSQRSDHVEMESSKPTHRWSDGLQTWVLIAEWASHHDREQTLLAELLRHSSPEVRYKVLNHRLSKHRQIIVDDDKALILEYLKTGSMPRKSRVS